MILPTTYYATLALLVLGMLFLASWPNTFKLADNWRFELYYFDFVFAVMAVASVTALTLGTLGFDGFSFRDDLLHASKKQDLYALLAGAIFNLANMLFLAAISLSGMAVVFPIAMGIALVIGVFWAYATHPQGSPVLLFAGAAIILLAVVAAAQAFKQYRLHNLDERVRTGEVKSTRKKVSIMAVVIALISGVLMSFIYPMVQRAMEGDTGLGPYSIGFLFALGMFLSTFLFNLFFMNLPVAGGPLEILDYFKGNIRQHLLGLAGGALWFTGTLFSLIGATAEGPVGVNSSLTQGLAATAAPIGALFGLSLWKEFRNARSQVRATLGVMLALYVLGLVMIAVAPLVGK